MVFYSQNIEFYEKFIEFDLMNISAFLRYIISLVRSLYFCY
ncbi:hypothetical protein DEU39_0142 [Chryseobacterium sp. AG363]|nr:hypothetical protein DEU39_0142 [Chryseobacterium sp. AG363]